MLIYYLYVPEKLRLTLISDNIWAGPLKNTVNFAPDNKVGAILPVVAAIRLREDTIHVHPGKVRVLI